jgi:hypothetical protein
MIAVYFKNHKKAIYIENAEMFKTGDTYSYHLSLNGRNTVPDFRAVGWSVHLKQVMRSPNHYAS